MDLQPRKTNLVTRIGIGCLAVGLALMDLVHLHGPQNKAVHFGGGFLLGVSAVLLLFGIYQQRRSTCAPQ
jgi:hypothetical protein